MSYSSDEMDLVFRNPSEAPNSSIPAGTIAISVLTNVLSISSDAHRNHFSVVREAASRKRAVVATSANS
jgi:hypothetical protein